MKTISCRPRTSIFNPVKYKFQHMLRNLKIERSNQIWAIDNVIVERFFRTIKYDKLYLESLETGADVLRACQEFIQYYNHKRDHSSIGNQPPLVFYKLAG